MIVNPATGYMMSQKQFPRMALIKPSIDEEQGVMRVRADGMGELIIPLEVCATRDVADEMDVKVCGDLVRSHQPSTEAAEWFSTFLRIPCQLHRFSPTSSCSLSSSAKLSRHTHFSDTTPSPMLLANESPFVLISQSSVDTVNSWIALDNDGSNSEPAPIHPSCFRANLMISLQPSFASGHHHSSPGTLSSTSDILLPFHEDTLDLIRIGTQTFQVLARCRRCLMICVNQATGERMKEPFCSLARHRRNGMKRIEFGVHLMWREDLSELKRDGSNAVHVGDRVAWSELM
jgi:molybdenum cofactor sulfurtransferase